MSIILTIALAEGPVVGKAEDSATVPEVVAVDDCDDVSLPDVDGDAVWPALVLLEFVAVLPEFDEA